MSGAEWVSVIGVGLLSGLVVAVVRIADKLDRILDRLERIQENTYQIRQRGS